MTAALATPFEVTGAAHLPARGGRSRCCGSRGSPARSRTAPARWRRRWRGFGPARVVGGAGDWAAVRDAGAFAGREGAVWRISVEADRRAGAGGGAARRREVVYDWAGGLLWVLAPEEFDLRAAMAGIPGHATLVRAGASARRRAGACSTPSRLRSRRCRRGCGRGSTRAGVLNPGRMARRIGGPGPEMQTSFTPEQLRDPATARSNQILRTCVHCGFCTATCPTYQVLGDELDSPRGRIYLIKDMLETGRPADEKTVKHIDRCLSCLACMTTCPSGVHYMHLVDHARAHIERDLPPAADGAGAALDAGAGPALSGAVPAGAARGQRSGGRSRGCCRSRSAAMLEIAPRALPPPSPMDAPQVVPGRGRAAQAGGAADRLRAAGAQHRHQRGDDPAADPARLRGGDRRGRRAAAAR